MATHESRHDMATARRMHNSCPTQCPIHKIRRCCVGHAQFGLPTVWRAQHSLVYIAWFSRSSLICVPANSLCCQWLITNTPCKHVRSLVHRTLRTGRHVLFRSFAFVMATPYNRRSFLEGVQQCLSPADGECCAINLSTLHTVICLRCSPSTCQCPHGLARPYVCAAAHRRVSVRMDWPDRMSALQPIDVSVSAWIGQTVCDLA
jgi:hypothetical protein